MTRKEELEAKIEQLQEYAELIQNEYDYAISDLQEVENELLELEELEE